MAGPEPDYQQAYCDWRADSTPEATGQFLQDLEPVIRRGVTNYGGGKNDPLIFSRARRLTLQALQSYDPRQGTQLSTHITNHLQGLRRVARQQQQILRTPERVSLDQAYLHRATAELTDELGREPSTAELADHTRLSPAKIARLRRYQPGLAEGALEENSPGPAVPTVMSPHYLATALYPELEPRDQQILEWSLGFHGQPQLSNNAIAQKLGLSAGAVSQRKARIQQKLDLLMEHL